MTTRAIPRHQPADYLGIILASAAFVLALSLPVWGHSLAMLLH
jgi:hypothetical protein